MDAQLLKTLGRTWWLRAPARDRRDRLRHPGLDLADCDGDHPRPVRGAYALVDGVAALVAGWQAKDSGRPMWTIVLVGVVGIAAGIFTFVQPGVTAIASSC